MAAKRAAKPTGGKGLAYAVTDASRNRARQTILKGLQAYNTGKVGAHRWQSVAVVLNDAKGKVIGGLSGHTGWGWMYVELFWLPEELRGQGHGRKLMELAEAEARKRGCVGMYLNTADFQAPKFYPKLGFELFAEIADFPPGHTTYYLMKRFAL
jgi:GNAT superfamily N-acetyltransferase